MGVCDVLSVNAVFIRLHDLKPWCICNLHKASNKSSVYKSGISQERRALTSLLNPQRRDAGWRHPLSGFHTSSHYLYMSQSLCLVRQGFHASSPTLNEKGNGASS